MKGLIKHSLIYVNDVRVNWARKKRMDYYEDEVRQFCVDNNIRLLDDSTMNDIQQFWMPYIHYEVQPYYYSMLASYYPEDILYKAVSEAVMYPNITNKLNDETDAAVLGNKGMYNVLFEGVKRPFEYVRNINGVMMDAHNNIVSTEEMVRQIIEQGEPIVIKPSTDTYGGHGVNVLDNYDEAELVRLLNHYGKNFVIQKKLVQSKQTARFNPTSLNTFRIVTLFLNGEISVLASAFKCGGKDSKVDNVSSGGMFVGIQTDGQLTRATSCSVLEINESPSGCRYSEYVIEHFDRVLNMAIDCHKRIPLCSLAGWDIALDSNDEPVFIEVNLKCPDVWLMQILNGPLFGDRLQEVLEYCFPSTNQGNRHKNATA